jgi:hypothetical protein
MTFREKNPKFATALKKDSGATDKELLEHDKPFPYGDGD